MHTAVLMLIQQGELILTLLLDRLDWNFSLNFSSCGYLIQPGIVPWAGLQLSLTIFFVSLSLTWVKGLKSINRSCSYQLFRQKITFRFMCKFDVSRVVFFSLYVHICVHRCAEYVYNMCILCNKHHSRM